MQSYTNGAIPYKVWGTPRQKLGVHVGVHRQESLTRPKDLVFAARPAEVERDPTSLLATGGMHAYRNGESLQLQPH